MTSNDSASQVLIRLTLQAFPNSGAYVNTARVSPILCVNGLREKRYTRDRTLRHNLISRSDGQTLPSMQATMWLETPAPIITWPYITSGPAEQRERRRQPASSSHEEYSLGTLPDQTLTYPLIKTSSYGDKRSWTELVPSSSLCNHISINCVSSGKYRTIRNHISINCVSSGKYWTIRIYISINCVSSGQYRTIRIYHHHCILLY